MATHPKLAGMSDAQARDYILARCHRQADALTYAFPHLGLIHARIRHRYTITRDVATFAISVDGRMFVNPDFCAGLTGEHVRGILAHEILHPTLDHFTRAQALGLITADHKPFPGKAKDLDLWNIACDMAINDALRADGIKLPDCVFYPPPDYSGPMVAEALFEHLRKNPPPPMPQGGQGKPQQGKDDDQGTPQRDAGQGCAMLPGDAGDKDGQGPKPIGPDGPGPEADGQGAGGEREAPLDWSQIGKEAQAMASMIGRGSSAIARLLSPYRARIQWERVIRRGFALADCAKGRESPTYSRMSRRAREDVIMPGWNATQPRVAVIIDVSGSMARQWVERIVAETIKLCQTYPGARAYLVTHTDQVCWEGWIRAGGNKAQITDSVQFSGGTDATPAYRAVEATGARFDALVHFTDCELGSWPAVPAKKLIVGAFGSGAIDPYCKPPEGAEIIPCVEG